MKSILAATVLLIGFWSFVEARGVILKCVREDWCELRGVGFCNIRRKRFPYAQLTQSTMEERFSNDGTPLLMGVGLAVPRYQIWLYVNREAIPLAPFYTYSKRETLEAVSRINAFIHAPQEQVLTVHRDNCPVAYSIAGICILLAGLIWFLIP